MQEPLSSKKAILSTDSVIKGARNETRMLW
jgi:hypothetical protein